MLSGHTDGLSELRSSEGHLLPDTEPELGDDEYEDCLEQIIYSASFEELASNSIHYDTVIWLSISLLLVLAWGIGIIMLLYVPFRRYVLHKDFSSRKLYITPTEIVYKVSRPSFIPFWGITISEKHVPLSLVIDIIIEQGCLQSVYGIHTFRVESIAYGKAASVDELQVQGVSNPGLLRKVIITEASKVFQDRSRNWKATALTTDGVNLARTGSLTEGPAVKRSPAKSYRMTGSPRYVSLERKSSGEMLFSKLEEVSKSVKKIEFLIEKSCTPSEGN